jgi:hypothetical protein
MLYVRFSLPRMRYGLFLRECGITLSFSVRCHIGYFPLSEEHLLECFPKLLLLSLVIAQGSHENNRLWQNNKKQHKGEKGKYNHACTREVSRNIRVYTRSDNKVMRLAPKKLSYLFINYNQLHRNTKFFHPQLFSQYQMNGFPVHVYFISRHLDC